MGEVGPDFWAVSDQIDATIRDAKAKLAQGPSLAEAVSALVIDRNRLLAERDHLRAEVVRLRDELAEAGGGRSPT